MFVCCLVRVFRHGEGGTGIMILMSIVIILFAILLIASCAAAFSETPRDRSDVFCFLVILASSVAVVLAFVVKGF